MAQKGREPETERDKLLRAAYVVLRNSHGRSYYDRHAHHITPMTDTDSNMRYDSTLYPFFSSQFLPKPPPCCMDCQSVTPQLRHIEYREVVSFLVGSVTKSYSGVFCPTCVQKRIAKANNTSGTVGLLSLSGLYHSNMAIGSNNNGGTQEPYRNMVLKAELAAYYAGRNDKASALVAATDAAVYVRAVGRGWWNGDERAIAEKLKLFFAHVSEWSTAKAQNHR